MRDHTTGGADRAQLILVGALALAVTLVGIALVLNSAIFAENLATRSNQGRRGRWTRSSRPRRRAVPARSPI